MKRTLTTFACSGLIALGFAFAGAPANASALSAGGALVNTVDKTAGQGPIVKVDRYERRMRRHYRRDRHWRRHGPRAGFYFEFGRPSPYYYARPRPARPYYRPRVSLSRAHVNWCYNRYRSYRAMDNSFQPYNGPRRLCISPYYR
ncbi:BA14K family protein [Nitratireductor pacificus]|uniref:Lectin-like protein BA14k n=1 Tax=Nitratireductor pacificus pht-3B TaxID=391937 RepID=K2LSW0_9HYPH|nr:BA14K family protein [Nitratireductor pacificus]EKF20864.1 BA14K-like protein [Nitratireductor pacificus pht-3B]